LIGNNFLPPMAVNAGAGITVSSVNVVGPNLATATFAISASATLGTRNVTVTTAGGTSNVAIFTVVSLSAPALTSVTPNSGSQGGTLSITLSGANFIAPMTVVAGAGITVGNVNVANSTSATADFTIAADAALGVRNVTATTSAGTTGAMTFTVIPRRVRGQITSQ
jgi:hypothetical protein